MDVTTLSKLVKLCQALVEVCVSPGQLALLHQDNLVIGGAGNLILNRPAAGLVADSEALDAMLNQLAILGDVISLGRGPFDMMAKIERIKFRLRRQDRALHVDGGVQKGKESILKAGRRCHGDNLFIGSGAQLPPTI